SPNSHRPPAPAAGGGRGDRPDPGGARVTPPRTCTPTPRTDAGRLAGGSGPPVPPAAPDPFVLARLTMTAAPRPGAWLRPPRPHRGLGPGPPRPPRGAPAPAARRAARLRLTELEARCNPVTVANPLANDPTGEPTTGSRFTQSETSSISFGSTVLVSFNDSG